MALCRYVWDEKRGCYVDTWAPPPPKPPKRAPIVDADLCLFTGRERCTPGKSCVCDQYRAVP